MAPGQTAAGQKVTSLLNAACVTITCNIALLINMK